MKTPNFATASRSEQCQVAQMLAAQAITHYEAAEEMWVSSPQRTDHIALGQILATVALVAAQLAALAPATPSPGPRIQD